MKIPASVIICTHNPRPDYLQRVLKALNNQTLSKEYWELLLIDNMSDERLSDRWDLSWHPYSRQIQEATLGLTPARIRGIREADGALLIFVDDDNVLAPDYLETALKIGRDWPMLGAWGGSIRGEFEKPIDPRIEPFTYLLTIRELTSDHWTNNVKDGSAEPYGAGMCIRKFVANAYSEECLSNPIKLLLGRKGADLASSEDIDLIKTCEKFNLGIGIFRRLELTHLISSNRTEIKYLLRLNRAKAASMVILDFIRDGKFAQSSFNLKRLIWEIRSFVTLRGLERKFFHAAMLGRRDAKATLDLLMR
jgi:glycosyltransferase involved in cell wall biosynthesis